jgi:hypothetical protein
MTQSRQQEASRPTVEPIAIPADLAVTLLSRRDRADVLLVPRRMDGDTGLYGDADLLTYKLLRATGVSIDWAHDESHRRFISEYSAEVVFAIALFVGQSLSEEAILTITRYLAGRIRQMLSHGTQGRGEAQLRVEIAHASVDGDRRELDGVRVSGQDGEQVVAVVREVLGNPINPPPEIEGDD